MEKVLSIKSLGREIIWTLVYYWRLGKQLIYPVFPIKSEPKVSAIIPVYSPERLRNVKRQIELLKKCDFIERIVISNHNPDIKLKQVLEDSDDRIVVVDQNTRRGCGYQWLVLKTFQPDLIFSIDDDMLLFPFQLVKVLEELESNPGVPHGVAGWSGRVYLKNQEVCVNRLTQFYAITIEHLGNYFELVDAIASGDGDIKELIEFWGDDLVISRTGSDLPRIHKVGVIIQDRTATKLGVATFTYDGFLDNRKKVSNLLKEITDITGFRKK